MTTTPIRPGLTVRVLAMLVGALLAACGGARLVPAPEPGGGPRFTVPAADLARPVSFIAYGDMRFTNPAERSASAPAVRQALIARIAAERPAAVFLSGDIPWHGGSRDDYAVYAQETAPWRAASLRVFPALGNHEFAGCAEAECLENWWQAFPDVRGVRWYAVALGPTMRAYALDSDAPLTDGSAQRAWLEAELAQLPPSVRFVMLWLHHPPVADLAGGALASHNPRPNEVALADYLRRVSAGMRVRFLVVAGHTHNYERLEQDGITYLVSGGGGAHPYPVERTAADRYQGSEFPNFHYLRFHLAHDRLVAEMVRVEDPDAAAPAQFLVRDRFEILAP